MNVKGSVFLEMVRAEGEVRLLGANRQQILDCGKGRIFRKLLRVTPLASDRPQCEVAFPLRRVFRAEGQVAIAWRTKSGGDLTGPSTVFHESCREWR